MTNLVAAYIFASDFIEKHGIGMDNVQLASFVSELAQFRADAQPSAQPTTVANAKRTYECETCKAECFYQQA